MRRSRLGSWLLALLLGTLAPAAASSKEAVKPPTPVPGLEFPYSIDALAAPAASTEPVRSAAVPWYPEHLVFDVKYGFIKGGQATLEMHEQNVVDGHTAFHIVSRANSNSFVDTFFRVRDINESWMDAASLDSLAYAKHLHEGRYIEDSYSLFDQENHTYRHQKIRPGRAVERSTGTVPSGVQDILSAFYYLRTQELHVGKDITLDVNADGNWPLVIKVLRKETVTVPFGTFDCFVVKPVMRKQGLFIQKGKELYVWITDNPLRMPVKMEVEIFIGHISAKLVDARRAP